MNNDNLYKSHNLAISIKARAKEQGVVLKDMLLDLGLGTNSMSALYHGKSIAFDSLAKIADYLNCSVDYLLGRDAAEKKPAENSGLEENMIIYSRDGDTIKKKMSAEQMRMLRVMLDALPEDDKPNL